jgi:hypothetical protein
MRTIFALCGLILIGGVYWGWRSRQLPTHFGEFTGAPQVAVADLVERPKDFTGKTVSVRGKVSEQCKTMGCYFFFPSAKGTLRVELKDVAMDAPMREGRPAHVEGQMTPFGDAYQLYATAVEFE